MTIWGLIEEDQHHLEALLQRLEREHERDELAEEFAHELTANLEAEEKALYEPLYERPGFRPSIIRMLAHDEKMRRMAEELVASPAQNRLGRIRELKAAFAKHVEEGAYVHPVAHRELSHHVMEHMKHDYEWAKHDAMRRLSKMTELAPADARLESLEFKTEAPHDRQALEHLLSSEQDSAFIAQAALDRSEEASHRSLLGEIAEMHLRAAHKLGTALAASKEKRRAHHRGGWLGGWLRVVSSAFIGEKALLKAVRSHEREALRMHEHMLRSEYTSPGMKKLLEHLIEHGREHDKKLEEAVAAYPHDVCTAFEKS